MPVKCTYGDLDRVRGEAYKKLWNYTFPMAIDGHRTRRFCKVLAVVVGEYEAELVKLAGQYGREKPNQTYEIPAEKVQAYAEAKRALDAVECEVGLVPLPFSTWSQVPLSAAEQDALEKFVEEFPAPRVVEKK